MKTKNKVLDSAVGYLRKKRPIIPESLNYTLRIEHPSSQPFVQIWFRTRGCRYSYRGSCSMCNYGISNLVSPRQMIDSVRQGLDTLNFEPAMLLLNSSGSVFDDWEVPSEARQEIFRLLSRYGKTRFIFETRADTISMEKILECTSILPEDNVAIEMGLESANPWVLKYCINKALNLQDIVTATQFLKKCKVESIVNILIGTPFLTFSEMVKDAVSSVNWAFEQGVDQCVLFPVNIKPWTLVYWLEERGMYIQPPLWALVEVLSKLESELLPRVHIAWYKARPQPHPEYKMPNRGPTTCPQCYDTVVNLLDEYSFSNNRAGIIQQLVNLPCGCKGQWYEQLEMNPKLNLYERVQASYEVIGKHILGEKWWMQHGETVLTDMSPIP